MEKLRIPLLISIEIFLVVSFVNCIAAAPLWLSPLPAHSSAPTTPFNQTNAVVTDDGAGGAIIAWEDYRDGNSDIYGQRVGGSGANLWSSEGVPVSTAPEDEYYIVIVSDGAGGAIIVWQNFNAGKHDLYAQRIDGSGTILWSSNGVPITTAANYQINPTIVTDDVGGAIIAWEDYRSVNLDIYAQRVDGAGIVQWTANGVPICTATLSQREPVIVGDGAGGAIIAWQDFRSGTNNDIYAQRVNSSGTVQWTSNGVPVCNFAGQQGDPVAVSGASAGAIIAWEDYRNGIDWHIYAQRVDGGGTTLWTANGIPVCTAQGARGALTPVSDGAGGGIIAWEDYRSGTFDIYAQRVDGGGTTLWTANGVPICTATGGQNVPMAVSDGAGGAIIGWLDDRSGTDWDIYAQRIEGAGTVGWTADGVPVCTESGGVSALTVASDGRGGAITAWEDYRDGTGYSRIYIQRLDSSGAAKWATDGTTETDKIKDKERNGNGTPREISLYQSYPNPSYPFATVRYDVPSPVHVNLSVYDGLGRLVMTLVDENQPAGSKSVSFDATKFSSGVYFIKLTAGRRRGVTKFTLLK